MRNHSPLTGFIDDEGSSELITAQAADDVAGFGEALAKCRDETTYPSETAFDLPLGGRSMMDYIALQGWDVYLFDVRGYGGSTRPPEMEKAGVGEQAHRRYGYCGERCRFRDQGRTHDREEPDAVLPRSDEFS